LFIADGILALKEASPEALLQLICEETFFLSGDLLGEDLVLLVVLHSVVKLLFVKTVFVKRLIDGERPNQRLSWLNLVRIELVPTQLRLLIGLFIRVVIMHLVIVSKKLLDSSAFIASKVLLIRRVNCDGPIDGRESNVLAIRGEINIDCVVHAVRLDGVGRVFLDFLYNF